MEPEPRQLLQPEETRQFPSDNNRDGNKKHANQRGSQPAEPTDPREKCANEIIKAQDEPERDQPSAGQERHDAPTNAASPRVRNAIDRAASIRIRLQRLEFRFPDRLDYRIIEAECAWLPSHRASFAHATLSPIRYWSAWSRRICGSDKVTPSEVRSSRGGRKRRNRTAGISLAIPGS